jgi:hypothetical protein
MPTWGWVLIAVGVAVVVGLALVALLVQRRSRRLRTTFGPEYDRTVAEAPTRREAEHELAERQKRREQFEIRPLSAGARDRYTREWQEMQGRFVDDPDSAVAEADRLVERVMAERGYPVEDFDAQAADLSVDHPDVVEDYREAHRVALSRERGEADTEDLRRALVRYRSLFERLLEHEEEPART